VISGSHVLVQVGIYYYYYYYLIDIILKKYCALMCIFFQFYASLHYFLRTVLLFLAIKNENTSTLTIVL